MGAVLGGLIGSLLGGRRAWKRRELQAIKERLGVADVEYSGALEGLGTPVHPVRTPATMTSNAIC